MTTSTLSPPKRRECVMRVQDASGDTKHKWNPDVPAEVNAARGVYDSMVGKGYKPYKVAPGGTQGERMRSFDPEAGEVLLVAPLAGG